MHPEIIKAELKIKGYSLTRLANILGVTQNTIGQVIRGANSRRVECAIAQVLGKTVEEVFPDRYTVDLTESA